MPAWMPICLIPLMLNAGPALSVVMAVREGLPPYENSTRLYRLEGDGCQRLKPGEVVALARPNDPQWLGQLEVVSVRPGFALARIRTAGDTFPLRGDLVLTPEPLPALPAIPETGPGLPTRIAPFPDRLAAAMPAASPAPAALPAAGGFPARTLARTAPSSSIEQVEHLAPGVAPVAATAPRPVAAAVPVVPAMPAVPVAVDGSAKPLAAAVAQAPAEHRKPIFFLPENPTVSPGGKIKLKTWVSAWGTGGRWVVALPVPEVSPLDQKRLDALRAELLSLGVAQVEETTVAPEATDGTSKYPAVYVIQTPS